MQDSQDRANIDFGSDNRHVTDNHRLVQMELPNLEDSLSPEEKSAKEGYTSK